MKKIHFYLFLVNLLISVPAIYMVLGLPLVFAENGWSGSMIGLFLLASVPSLGKFFLTYPVERFRYYRAHYVVWGCVLLLVLLFLLLLLAMPWVPSSKPWLFALMLLANLLVSWVEIPVNTLAIQLLPEAERLKAGSLRSAAMSLSAVLGGGVLLLIQQQAGWSVPFWIMSASMVLAIACLLLMAPDERVSSPEERPVFSIGDMLSIFRGQYWAWLCLLFLWFALIAAIWTFLKPLLFASGMAPSRVAIIVGLGGGGVSAMAAFLAPVVLSRFERTQAMRMVALLDVVIFALFAALVWVDADLNMLGTAAMLIAVTVGLTSATIFRLMMDFVQTQGRPVYYGMQSAIFQSGRILCSVMAGISLDYLGYGGLLVLVASLMAGVYLLISASRGQLRPLFSGATS